MADTMPLDAPAPDAEIERLSFHAAASVQAPQVAQILLEQLSGAVWDAFFQQYTEHGEDILARCRWAEAWLPRSRQNRQKANTLWFIISAIIADLGHTRQPTEAWKVDLAAVIDWNWINLNDLIADCPHLVPPTLDSVQLHRHGLATAPDVPFLALWHGGNPPRNALWRHHFHPTVDAETTERPDDRPSVSALRYQDLVWAFGSTPELIMLAPLAAMVPGHDPADSLRRLLAHMVVTDGLEADAPKKVKDILVQAGIWHGSISDDAFFAPSPTQPANPSAICTWHPDQLGQPAWDRWLATPTWWSDRHVVQEMASCEPIEMVAALAHAVAMSPVDVIRDISTHVVDVLLWMSSWPGLFPIHPSWGKLFQRHSHGSIAVSGIGTGKFLSGNPDLQNIMTPFTRAMFRRTDVDTMPEMVSFRRDWMLLCLDWVHSAPIPASGIQEEADSVMKHIDGSDGTETSSCARILTAARHTWHDIAVAARQDQTVDTGIHDARLAMELIIRTKGFCAGFKAIMLVLRALRQPSVGPSLATSSSVDGGNYMQGTEETRNLPWSWIADDGVSIIQALRIRDRVGSSEMLQEIGEMLVDRLKPAPRRKPDQQRSSLVLTSGAWHSEMLEPSAIWRRGYVRAIGELAVPQPHRICRVLEHVRQMDPDSDVKSAANEAITRLTERSRRLGHDAPARLLMHVWWRLRWTHRLALGLHVEHLAAFGTRRIEVRTKRKPS